jgi:hypothetical protein
MPRCKVFCKLLILTEFLEEIFVSAPKYVEPVPALSNAAYHDVEQVQLMEFGHQRPNSGSVA